MWFQSVLLQVLVLLFNPCHFIQGGLAGPEHFSGVTEEVVRPKRRMRKEILVTAVTSVPQQPEGFILGALYVLHIHTSTGATPRCVAQSLSLLTCPFVLVPRALSPSVSHSEATAQPGVSTAASLQLSSSHHELGALWSALSVLW